MASPKHQQLLLHNTEVSCDSSGDSNSVTVKINSKQQQGPCGSKHCKYSISSSCSSGESGIRRGANAGVRRRKKLPQLFERASRKWWNPKFDSSNLEEACMERCFPQTQRRFRYALSYVIVACLLWGIFFAIHMKSNLIAFLVPTLCFLLVCVTLFILTFTRLYARYYVWVSLILTLMVFTLTLTSQFQVATTDTGGVNQSLPLHLESCLSPVGSFSICVEVLLLLYTVMHLPLYLCVFLGILYSVLFETFGYSFSDCLMSCKSTIIYWEVVGKALLHICIHAIGIHLFIMNEVRSRSTFLKVGQSIMHGKDLEVEKALKERMIHSVMPRLIADKLMKQGDDESENSVKRYSTSSPKSKKKKSSIPKAQIIFRPFTMQRMEPVSILFADIVGFTKMSANKSAHALVGLLNDLFGRFDRLCEDAKCEKISTLGDCYYCVAGCPEPRDDHAYCCIEMGLGMIEAIEQFCQEKKEMVNMRVGVHTGTVLCGILGMRRFKFDVWSNDVNLANLMEQLGVAGKVHISETTANYLDDRYQMEDGQVIQRVGQNVVADQLKGLKTYLISGRKVEESHCSCSRTILPVPEGGDTSSLSSGSKPQGGLTPENTGDFTQTNSQAEKAKAMCPSCNVTLTPSCDVSTEEGAVQNGGQEERKTNSKAPGIRNPKAQNGLLSPPQDEKLTNSQTSLYEMLQEKGRWCGVSLDQSALLPLRYKNIREKTDAHFVDVIKEDSLMKDYFFKPPINKLSMHFLDKELEEEYRASYQEEVVKNASMKTFASATFSSLLDVFLSTTVFIILSITCFLKQGLSTSLSEPAAIAVFIIALLLEVLSLIISVRMAFYLEDVMACTKHLLRVISGWLPRHFIGAILISLPALAVFSHITNDLATNIHYTMFMCCAIIITIIQYCNFCQLSSWMRSTLATIVGAVMLILLYVSSCCFNISKPEEPQRYGENPCSSSVSNYSSKPVDLIGQEVILAFFLLFLLVWFLNREFEVSYRLHYHGNVEADLHRTKIQSMRDQADWLLRNIIPYHVAEQLKVSQSYSKNHDNVGVIFASIVNFSEFYEENYEGGKECYRVLNELIGDFDELLSKSQFSNIEKIKTIGATYMAASGLNPSQCQDSNQLHGHLQTLFEFAKEMMRVVDDFNKDMLWFNFKLRIGFNHGPLTAGVIGTTKLLYDIWGDTVNIASRMDTTGVECRIQVSEESYRILCKMGYDFDYRGTVNVKGKGQMKTYLFPKYMDNGIMPQHQLSVSPDIRVQVDGSIGRSPTDELASMVPSLQSSDKSSHCSDSGEVKDLLSSSQKLMRDLANIPDKRAVNKKVDDEDYADEDADELTKLKVSESL
uniref:Adenylate cyclase type 9 n=1 Tax=Latimeria chalumnae TaxID=7897 RepID=M3XKK8_LATCH|nr:PREDICTED: adenylate cyclase type 9 isoform X1 [Latimeria chalumnae]|eukprot:XP_005990723.1 PREDICTED: adenylate cyclase type 9 isoform X1 [Latimeria chalumnae]